MDEYALLSKWPAYNWNSIAKRRKPYKLPNTTLTKLLVYSKACTSPDFKRLDITATCIQM